MKIFVTGSTGYIGSHLVKALVADGHQVNALCRSEKKYLAIKSMGVNPIYGDLDDESALKLGMDKCGVVFHVAAMAQVWAKDTGQFYRVNVEGTNRVLRIAKELDVSRVVFTSTAGIYGASISGVITENTVRQKDFFNEYEGSKCLAESWVKDYVIQGLDVVIVSPTRVYGPYLFGQPESITKIITSFVERGWRWIPGPTNRLGNYVYIDDVVKGHVLAMKNGKKGRTYILGGTNHSYLELFMSLRKISGINRRLFTMPLVLTQIIAFLNLKIAQVFGIPPVLTPKWVAKAKYHWEVDASRSSRELGLKITPLEEGLKETVDWIRS